ncbi:unnamed protein product [Cuscuta europaea]|uniref:DUF674 domain-containing protein n=1 Tax=Cuscuta europaea TaxID=41803 RepID=A0A9P1DYH7_CUSEU|nr:unnamed protein product [Cuscuta europaea]
MQADGAPPVSLKLLINKKDKKVVFAEAEKPFVDFLFYLMSLPMGTVIKLVTQKSMVGALGKLYGSISDLSDTYLQPGTNKDTFLNPKTTVLMSSEVPRLMPPAAGFSAVTKKVYACPKYLYGTGGSSSCRNTLRFTDDPKAVCPGCHSAMSAEMNYVAPVTATAASSRDDDDRGFVRGVVTYMVMDDLKVMPHSTISTITALNEHNVKDFGSLEVKVVQLGIDSGLKLLKAALHTNSVLTTVFLGK